MTKFVSDLRQVAGYSGFINQYNWPPWYNWNIVNSGVKYHNTKANPQQDKTFCSIFLSLYPVLLKCSPNSLGHLVVDSSFATGDTFCLVLMTKALRGNIDTGHLVCSMYILTWFYLKVSVSENITRALKISRGKFNRWVFEWNFDVPLRIGPTSCQHCQWI